mgnify:CR=1 FL=1
MRLPSGLLVGCLALGLFAGCEQQPVTQQVQGTVKFQGKPLDHGMVSFLAPGARPIGAPIATDGTYQVQLPPGDYDVVVISPPKLPEGFKEGDPLPQPLPEGLPAKFSRKESSGLSASIELQESPQKVDFELK